MIKEILEQLAPLDAQIAALKGSGNEMDAITSCCGQGAESKSPTMISGLQPSRSQLRFIDNCIGVIDGNQELVALWLHPCFI